MEIADITQYVEIVKPLGWVGVALVSLYLLFRSGILSGIGKRLGGRMDDSHAARLTQIETNDLHDLKELRKDMRSMKEEQINQGKDIARLLTKVFNGNYRR